MKASTVLLTSVFTVSCIESSWDVDGDRDHTSRDVETKGEVATPRRSFSFLFFFFAFLLCNSAPLRFSLDLGSDSTFSRGTHILPTMSLMGITTRTVKVLRETRIHLPCQNGSIRPSAFKV